MVRASDSDPAAANLFAAVLGDPARGGLLQQRATSGGPTTRARPTLACARASGCASRAGADLHRLALLLPPRLGKDWHGRSDLPAEVAAGIAVAARSPAAATTAENHGLRLHDLDAEGATRGWQLDELGTVGGSAVYGAPGTLTLSGMGDGYSLLAESGVFAFQPANGRQSLTVRVAAFAQDDPVARVGLIIRQGPPVSFARTQPAVLLAVTAGMGVQFQSRASNNLAATVAPPKEGKAPVWLRLERTEEPGPPVSSRFTGSVSADGRTWTVVGTAKFAMPEPFLIGVLTTSTLSTGPATATVTNLSLTSAPTPPPAPAPDAARPPTTTAAEDRTGDQTGEAPGRRRPSPATVVPAFGCQQDAPHGRPSAPW